MHSNLIRVTSEMAGCNGFAIKPFEQWPELRPEFDVLTLDEQASKLEGEQLLIFVDGEETEVKRITEDLQLTELNQFLNEVFDGYLHNQISCEHRSYSFEQSKYSNPIDQIIYELFSSRWTGESVTCSLEAMKKQLYKNLTDQVNGYWSGHTAYQIMIDGGFLIDAPNTTGKPKQLTKLGELFFLSMEKAGERG